MKHCNYLFLLSCLLANASAARIACTECEKPGCYFDENVKTFVRDAVCVPVENYYSVELEKQQTKCPHELSKVSTSFYEAKACEFVANNIGDAIQAIKLVRNVRYALTHIKGIKDTLVTWNQSNDN